MAGRDEAVDNALLKERDALHTQVAKMENDIRTVADRVRDIKTKGHVVMAGDGTTVIIGSDVSNSFNVVRNNDPALADALQTISGAVEKSGNKEAGLAWERFMKQALGERDKITLSSL
jgi:D-arabinose 5-phosphate isomerase GutQ